MNGQDQSALRELFGGAIKAAIPAHFLDVSTFRTIPDNQEIFVSNQTETSLLIDILERLPFPDHEAARYHFDALAQDNEVDEDDTDAERIFFVRRIRPPGQFSNIACQFLQGYQRIVKGHYRSATSTATASSTAPLQSEYVLISLLVLRLENQSTDLVISSNCPVRDESGVEAIHGDLDSVRRYIEGNGEAKEAERLVFGVLDSLEVLDWGLFDEDDEE